MKKQITFFGDYSEGNAAQWIHDLARCFTIKKLTLTRLPWSKSSYAPKSHKYRIEVKFE